jgi:hydrogenase expression/formation protein HypC
MQVTHIDGLEARCEAKGRVCTVNLMLLLGEELQPGDFVVVHTGHATERISPERAHDAWSLYDEMLAAQAGAGHG